MEQPLWIPRYEYCRGLADYANLHWKWCIPLLSIAFGKHVPALASRGSLLAMPAVEAGTTVSPQRWPPGQEGGVQGVQGEPLEGNLCAC